MPENLINSDFLDHIADGCISIDADWNIAYMNKKACDLLGCRPKEVTGTNFWKNFPSLEKEAYGSGLIKAMNEKQHVRMEYYHCSSKQYFESNFYPALKGVSVIFHDITDKKKAESELSLTSLKLNHIYKTIDSSFWGADIVNRRMSYVSPYTETIYGYTEKDFLNNPDLWEQVIIPEDKQLLPGMYSEINRGNPVTVEYRIKSADGSTRWIETRMTPTLDEQGKMVFLDGITNDVTDRKNAETKLEEQKEFYENVLNILPTDVAVFDPDHRYLFVNPAAIKNEEYRKFIIGKDDFEYCEYRKRDKSTAEFRRSKFLEAVKKGEPNEWEDSLKDPDGNIITHWRKMVPVYDKKGDLNMVVGLGIDFTDLKRTEEKLKQLSYHLQNAREEERITIAREIHDELGQRLTTLKLDASLLKKRILPENKKAHDKIDMMISMLDDTLKTVRRIATELRPSILDDVGLAEALNWQSREFEKRTGIITGFTSLAEKNKFDKNISTQVFRIFQEALTNISRHAKATEVNAVFNTINGYAVLTVHDNGKGFSEQEAKNKKTLGLVGMKERAAMISGALTIESVEGHGTTIELQLPLPVESKIAELQR